MIVGEAGSKAHWMAKAHPNKHIREAIKYAEQHGWTFTASRGHNYGLLWCPEASRAGCRQPVYSTPRNPQNHANDIRRSVDACPHDGGGQATADQE